MKAPPRFIADETKLPALLDGAKLFVCPHCGRAGTLIGHGKLRGYSATGSSMVVRGQRLFCSNRHRRGGCGRTCSTLVAHTIRGFSVWTHTLVALVVALIQGNSCRAAWKQAAPTLGLSSVYRLWRRLDRAQVHIRAKLFTRCPPPASTQTLPWAQLLEHLRLVLEPSGCLFASFQHDFQVDLMG